MPSERIPTMTHKVSGMPIEMMMVFITEEKKNTIKIPSLEPQKTPNSQSNLQEEKQRWRHHTS